MLALEPRHLFQSMTAYHNPRLWQNVDHLPIGAVPAYVRLRIRDERTVVISVKKRELD